MNRYSDDELVDAGLDAEGILEGLTPCTRAERELDKVTLRLLELKKKIDSGSDLSTAERDKLRTLTATNISYLKG